MGLVLDWVTGERYETVPYDLECVTQRAESQTELTIIDMRLYCSNAGQSRLFWCLLQNIIAIESCSDLVLVQHLSGETQELMFIA